MVLLSIDKQAIGQGRQAIEAVWSGLEDVVDPKFVIVCDDDVNIRDWNDVIWAVTTRMDPARDSLLYTESKSGVSRMAWDATNKLGDEKLREWGIPIKKDPELVAKIDAIWHQLGIE
ncbi:3-polyprenyl-4-hydroxybenzoate carboxy-lyase [Vibrio ponticus]|nr:3-polyprenyl-4-hydroxybenzoate carboxy-lyase [Vibrio ponticus]